MELKDQIRIAREAKGLSQSQLAERLGISRQSIVWWEDGVHRPKTNRVRSLEEALEVRLDLAERGNATPLPLRPEGPSLSVNPEMLRLAVAIGRLPRAQRDAIVTLAFIGQDKALKISDDTEQDGLAHRAASDLTNASRDTIEQYRPNGSADFSTIESEIEYDAKRKSRRPETGRAARKSGASKLP